VLAPTAASGAEARHPAAVRVAAPAAPARTTAKCPTTTDWRLQKSAHLTSTTGSPVFISGDQVQLWYSQSTRCVYGKFLADDNSSCTAPSATCKVQVTVLNADGSIDPAHPTCFVPSGAIACATAAIDDAGRLATAEGWRTGPIVGTWYGKTEWW
jgi:hypothetical protein